MIAPLTSDLSADAVPLERLTGNPRLTEAQKVGEAARQFESLLLRQIFAEAQKPLLHATAADNSTTATIYRDMLSNQLADSVSKSGSFGLARSLSQQLAQEANTPPPFAKAEAPAAAVSPALTNHPSVDRQTVLSPANEISGSPANPFVPDRS